MFEKFDVAQTPISCKNRSGLKESMWKPGSTMKADSIDYGKIYKALGTSKIVYFAQGHIFE